MEIKDYSKNYNELTRMLLQRFSKEKKEQNLVLSLMSIIMLLGIAAESVDGKAKDEIRHI